MHENIYNYIVEIGALRYGSVAMKDLLRDYIEEKRARLGRDVSLTLLGLGSTSRAALDILLGMKGVSISLRHPTLPNHSLPPSVTLHNSPGSFYEISEDVILPSPSLRRERYTIPEGSEYVTDLDLLFAHRPSALFSVSGSDGKSTVTTLSSMLLRESFPTLFTGGNIGTPLFCASAGSDGFLLELSSFSLRYSVPKNGRAVLTNVTPNHLDWHANLAEYEECKIRLIRKCDEPILNLCDPVSERQARGMHSFALVSDRLRHDEIKSRYRTEHTVTVTDGAVRLDGVAVVPMDEIKRKERHNLINLALATAMSIGYADREQIRRVASSFDGLLERCESITLGRLHFISSSIDTTPQRTATTLAGLGRPVRIILGGRGKGLSLKPLREPLVRFAQRISVYGEIRHMIEEFIDSDRELRRIPHRSFESLGMAIDYACEDLLDGETVLLSPAATSYGEFTDYVQRGRYFKDRILEICRKI